MSTEALTFAEPAIDPSFENVWDELVWRGLVHVSTDQQALRDLLAGDPITYYCGFDPTAPSLHLGNLVQLLTLRRIQLAGHRPLGLVGGSTGLIGDPRPSAERTLNTPEVVAEWVTRLRGQVERFLSFDGDNAARIVNNLDWTAPLSAIDFLREIGKHYRVGTMLKKDAVAARLNSDAGISYTEFSYQILQGMDYLEREHGDGAAEIYAHRLGSFLVDAVQLFRPRTVLLTGGIVVGMGDALHGPVAEQLHTLPHTIPAPRVVYSPSRDTALFGAAVAAGLALPGPR